jgi:hypothetical protein
LRLTSGWSGVGVGTVLVFVAAVGVCVVAYRDLLVGDVVVIAVLLLLYVDWIGWLVGLCITKRSRWSIDW